MGLVPSPGPPGRVEGPKTSLPTEVSTGVGIGVVFFLNGHMLHPEVPAAMLEMRAIARRKRRIFMTAFFLLDVVATGEKFLEYAYGCGKVTCKRSAILSRVNWQKWEFVR